MNLGLLRHSAQRIAQQLGVFEPIALFYLRRLARKHAVSFERSRDDGSITLRRGNKVLRAASGHYVYCADLIRDFDYYFDAVLPEQNGEDLIVDYSTARLHTLTRSRTSFYFTSFAEPDATTDIYLEKARLKEGETVLDLGAYCGIATWAFSKGVGPSGRVISFEPDAGNYAAFRKNIELHQLQNVTAINQGIWSAETVLEFQAEGNMGSSVSELLGRQNATRSVAVTTIDAAVRAAGLASVDFIKMDIEGAEVEALAGAVETLRKFRPRLIIEPHVVHGTITTAALCRQLEALGYKCTALPQAGLPLPLLYAHYP